MSRIFITGSSDGLGLMAAQLLVKQGHSVVIHCFAAPSHDRLTAGELLRLTAERSAWSRRSELATV